MKLRNVHLIIFLILIVLAISVSFVAVQSINNLSELSKEISLQFEQSIIYEELQAKAFQLVKSEKDYILTQDPKELEIWNSEQDKLNKIIEQAFTQLAEEEERGLLEIYKEKDKEYHQNLFEIQKFVEAGDIEKSSKLSREKSDVLADEQAAIAVQLVEFNKKQVRDAGATSEALTKRNRTIAIILGVLIFLIGIFSAYFISRMISVPLSKLTESVDQVSKGNFKVQIEKDSKIDEINSLTDSLSRVLASMKLAILRVGVRKEDMGIKTEETQNSLMKKLKPTNEELRKIGKGVKKK